MAETNANHDIASQPLRCAAEPRAAPQFVLPGHVPGPRSSTTGADLSREGHSWSSQVLASCDSSKQIVRRRMRSYRKGTGSWRGTHSRLKVCRLSSMALGPRRQKRDEARSTVTVYGSLTPFPIKVFHSRFFSACSFGWWSPGRLRVANLSVVAMFYVNFWNFLHHRFWLSCLRTKQTPWSAIRSLCGYGAWITKFDFFFVIP